MAASTQLAGELSGKTPAELNKLGAQISRRIDQALELRREEQKVLLVNVTVLFSRAPAALRWKPPKHPATDARSPATARTGCTP